jgi:hypothetical protein
VVGEVLLMMMRLRLWGAGRPKMGERVWNCQLGSGVTSSEGLATGGPSRRWSEVP